MKKYLLFSVCYLAAFFSFASPLPASDVFKVSAHQIDPNTFALSWQIKPGYFLYRDRIKLSEKADSNVHLGSIRFPASLEKTDRQGKTYRIYRDDLTLPVAILGEQPGETLINFHFQGCADDGFCYPPETKQIKLTINDDLALAHVSLEDVKTPMQPETTSSNTSSNEIDEVFIKHGWAMIILSFFGFGLLLSFTPCVLPMVPVLSGIIVGHGKDLSTRKAFFLSLSYVLSMSVTYALVGAVVASLGSNLQIAMQSPWAISFFSLVFVLLALSMFNFYELRLPASWQAKLAQASRGQASGHYLSAAIMGSLSTLILSPCVTAPLVGALGYIAQSGDIMLGTLALFFLGLGMGTPLLLIGTSAGKWLPRAGLWMNGVKAFFGVMLIAVAIYLMGRILPPPLTMGLWAALLIFSGIYLGALIKANTSWDKFRQGTGIILLVYGLLMLVGASMGGENPLQPLAVLASPSKVIASPIKTEVVKTVNEVRQAIANAKGKPVMLDFYADWCSSCKVMEATTFQDPRVQTALNDFIVLKADVTANNRDSKELLKHFNVIAPPTFLFFNTEGIDLKHLRLIGDTTADKFLKNLNQTIKNQKADN